MSKFSDGTESNVCLAICMPIARAPSPLTNRSLRELDIPKPAHVFDPEGLMVDQARNSITQAAMSLPEITHLMWIDDDMVFGRDAFRRLLAHDLPIVGGLCHNRRHPYMPILMHATQRGAAFQYDYPEGLVEVDATGAAFLLVKREVYEKIRAEFPNESPWDRVGAGEDVDFCNRARACGYKIMVDTTVKIGHVGEVVVDEKFAQRNREFRSAAWYPKKERVQGAKPVASLIVPAWNSNPEYLRAAIESGLEQTVPVEIIVVDDGSDNGEEIKGITESLHVPLIRIPHGGSWKALNAGIRAMSTDWACWLSHDDVFYPIKIEQQLAAMQRESKLASFHAYDILINGTLNPNVISPFPWKTFDEQQKVLARVCAINGLTMMVHRSVFDTIGLFSESPDFSIVADWEFWNRVAQKFLWLPISDVLATRREHPDNASKRFAADPVKMEKWNEEIARVMAIYGNVVDWSDEGAK